MRTSMFELQILQDQPNQNNLKETNLSHIPVEKYKTEF